MKRHRPARVLAASLLLIVLYVVLFSMGGALLPPEKLGDLAPPVGTEQQAMLAIGVVALVDTILLVAWIRLGRMHGLGDWAAAAAVFFGIKSVTTQLEAWWFLPMVDGEMAARFAGMYLPVAIGWTGAAIGLLGDREAPERPALPVPAMWPVRLGLLSAVAYPVLFFAFGYFVAMRSPELLELYGISEVKPFFEHMVDTLTGEPLLYPFEVFRGLIWVGLAWLICRPLVGRPVAMAVLTGLFFSLVQNDVHLMPSSMMTPEVQRFHFAETASSNLIWGALVAFVLWGDRRAQSG